jgi:phage N-6-adenine-methyltransferase
VLLTLNKALFTSTSAEYKTPRWLYDKLNSEFSFDLDPCTTEDNPLGTKYFMTMQTNGLLQSWDFAKAIFINPPYNREVGKWVKKAAESTRSNLDQIIVMLITARTDTRWFHSYIYAKPNVEIRFLKGRLRFKGTKYKATFPSMVVIFRGRDLANAAK